MKGFYNVSHYISKGSFFLSPKFLFCAIFSFLIKNNSSYFLGLDLLGHHLKHWREFGEWGNLSGNVHVFFYPFMASFSHLAA